MTDTLQPTTSTSDRPLALPVNWPRRAAYIGLALYALYAASTLEAHRQKALTGVL